jgi:hypothetical protein
VEARSGSACVEVSVTVPLHEYHTSRVRASEPVELAEQPGAAEQGRCLLEWVRVLSQAGVKSDLRSRQNPRSAESAQRLERVRE